MSLNITDLTTCPHCQERHSINLQQMCGRLHDEQNSAPPGAVARTLAQWQSLSDTWAPYDLVRLSDAIGEIKAAFAADRLEGREGYEERWAIRLSGGRLIECPDEESARRMAERIGHGQAPEKILVAPGPEEGGEA